MKVYVVSTVDPEAGGQCITPNVFATEAEAVAFLDGVMRQEWETYGLEDDEDEPRPYPGDWQKASDALAAHFTDGSYGEWMLTPHEVPSDPALAMMLAALKSIRADILVCGLEGFYSEAKGAGLSGAVAEVDAAIAAAEGREG